MIEKVFKIAAGESARHKQGRIVFTLAATVVTPAAIGVWGTFASHLIGLSPWLFWSVLALLVMFQLFFAVPQLLADAGSQEIYFFAREIDTERLRLEQAVRESTASIEGLTGEIRRLIDLTDHAAGWLTMLGRYRGTGEPPSDAIGEIMAVLVERRGRLFGIETDELWNFAVYRFEKDKELLTPMWRERHPSHPSTTLGRVFRPHEGHVGRTFAVRSPIVTRDATLPEISQYTQLGPDKQQPYDMQVYRSFAAIPLGSASAPGGLTGVLVATSDRVGRFDEAKDQHLRPLRLAAAALDSLFRRFDLAAKRTGA